MVYEFEELYIAGFIHMFILWKNSLLFAFCILFYFILYFHFMMEHMIYWLLLGFRSL